MPLKNILLLSRILLGLGGLGLTSPASAAVIFSNCPVALTEQAPGSLVPETVDRFKPSDFTNTIHSYSRELPKALDFVAWLLSDNDQYAKMKNTDEPAQAGLFLEDYEFVSSLASEPSACHDERNKTSRALYIQPFAIRLPNGPAVTNLYNIGFKVCPYLVTKDAQLPILDGCEDLGRASGYGVQELKNRIAVLALHIDKTQRAAKAATLGAGVVGSLAVFKIVRVLSMGRGSSFVGAAALGAIPTGLAYVSNELNYTDSLVQNVVDFRDAAQVALTGDLTTAVKVNMPMEDFLPYFQRYLDSMDSGLVKPGAPQPGAPKP